jgi:hypothetical protein
LPRWKDSKRVVLRPSLVEQIGVEPEKVPAVSKKKCGLRRKMQEVICARRREIDRRSPVSVIGGIQAVPLARAMRYLFD